MPSNPALAAMDDDDVFVLKAQLREITCAAEPGELHDAAGLLWDAVMDECERRTRAWIETIRAAGIV